MTNADNAAPGRQAKAYLVGGGIAALASAAYLIRDGGFAGQDIEILEDTPRLGGSLDGAGDAHEGYVIRGGRMFTYEAYTCTFDLLSFIPSLGDPGATVKDEIYRFNIEHASRARARLVAGGRKLDASDLKLSNRDRLDLIEIMAVTESSLGTKRIEEVFQPSFFSSNFWFMWCTTFAFQPWHGAVELKRYLHRFIQELPRIDTLAGVRRTPFNQYDSIVRPLVQWLEAQGVRFRTGARVVDLDFRYGPRGKVVETVHYLEGETPRKIAIGDEDLVFVTNGSMTAASSLGSMDAAARLERRDRGASWALWETLAEKHADFGHPEVFTRNIDESKWLSFTVTLNDPAFFRLMEAFTGNAAGTGGLVTFIDSSWLMSIVLAHQPHFLGQPRDTQVFWGYGLFVDQEGDFVKKKMSHCTGEELLIELLGHLRIETQKDAILSAANRIPCMMPFITSQFMPRAKGDRPDVRPVGTGNLAFIGQYCEIPDDVVFTVEYSVRSAQIAVYSLLGLEKAVSPLYKGQFDPAVAFAAAKTLVS
ncbi:oleate hydratase [Phenylobacterium sp.]|uniref:oleate hydratase n=1 Tax=Phenylobacterium sp. TaxID=1871053 RepID=UPI00374D9561